MKHKTISEKKFNQFYEEHHRKAIKYALKITRNIHSAEDVAQEAFKKLYEQDYDKIKSHASNWLYTVVHNLAVKQGLRKQLYAKKIEMMKNAINYHDGGDAADATKNPLEYIIDVENCFVLRIALEKINPRYKEILILRYVKDLPYTEIGNALQVTVNNVGVLLNAAKKKLAQEFNKAVKNVRENTSSCKSN